MLPILLAPLLTSLGLSQWVCAGTQFVSTSPMTSFLSTWFVKFGNSGDWNCVKLGILGSGIREFLLEAMAEGTRGAIMQMEEALPGLFGSRVFSAMSGLFSFSAWSMHLMELSIVAKGIKVLMRLFSVSGLAELICWSLHHPPLTESLKFLRLPRGRFASADLISALFCSS